MRQAIADILGTTPEAIDEARRARALADQADLAAQAILPLVELRRVNRGAADRLVSLVCGPAEPREVPELAAPEEPEPPEPADVQPVATERQTSPIGETPQPEKKTWSRERKPGGPTDQQQAQRARSARLLARMDEGPCSDEQLAEYMGCEVRQVKAYLRGLVGQHKAHRGSDGLWRRGPKPDPNPTQAIPKPSPSPAPAPVLDPPPVPATNGRVDLPPRPAHLSIDATKGDLHALLMAVAGGTTTRARLAEQLGRGEDDLRETARIGIRQGYLVQPVPGVYHLADEVIRPEGVTA